mmetsp:Transcript_99009/g.176383  ORF Transcript_99009/g.176383 Transcript_99009/m.176383 type:complete len:167 (-) Transcript_99009:2590-3090(-)
MNAQWIVALEIGMSGKPAALLVVQARSVVYALWKSKWHMVACLVSTGQKLHHVNKSAQPTVNGAIGRTGLFVQQAVAQEPRVTFDEFPSAKMSMDWIARGKRLKIVFAVWHHALLIATFRIGPCGAPAAALVAQAPNNVLASCTNLVMVGDRVLLAATPMNQYAVP